MKKLALSCKAFTWKIVVASTLLMLASISNAANVILPNNSVAGLITAISNANVNPGTDSIDLNGFTFTLTVVNNVTTGSNGLPSITDPSELLITNGTIERDPTGPNFRLFHVASTGRLSLTNVTLRNGFLTGLNNDTNAGGAVFVAASGKLATVTSSVFTTNHAMRGSAIHLSGLTTIDLIVDSTFSENASEDIGTICVFGGGTITEIRTSTFSGNRNGDGGAVALRGVNPNISTLSLVNNSLFSGNISDRREEGAAIRVEFFSAVGTIENTRFLDNVGGFGGAISLNNRGTIETIVDSTFERNIAETFTLTNSPVGGAIFVLGSTPASGITLIERCTFRDNQARMPPIGNPTTASGGAIHAVIPGAGTAFITTIRNSTFYNNAAQAGGGISISTGAALTTLANTTIASNNASVAGGGLRVNNSMVANLVSTIIATNTAPTGPDIVVTGTGAITTTSENFIGIDLGHSVPNGPNQVGTLVMPLDPLLNTPQNNGGLTETMALQAGSLAIDTGSNPLLLLIDQRAGPRVVNAVADVGAYERGVDSDSDGIEDDNDNCLFVSNPGQENSDADSLGDACDNCLLVDNEDQSDTNNNDIGDVCEQMPPVSSGRGSGGGRRSGVALLPIPCAFDTDRDGLNNCLDACPTKPGPDFGCPHSKSRHRPRALKLRMLSPRCPLPPQLTPRQAKSLNATVVQPCKFIVNLHLPYCWP